MPNLPCTPSLASLASLASLVLLSGCATAVAYSDDVAALRARGPSGLAPLLARWDAMPAGAARDALARTIDDVAAQRYATVSRLYWYTDLPAARAAAQAQGKPILALRLLGRLDQDLSCANSRLFRATLYANQEVSAFLRDNFVLHWSSERDVPRVTVDFGDGRKLETTITGNSAHFVLDADGTVLDVLPGLYAPVAFKAELTRTLAFVRTLPGARDRDVAIAGYHREALAETEKTWAETRHLEYIEGRRVLLSRGDIAAEIVLAMRATFSKAYIEMALAQIASGVDLGDLSEKATAQWAAIGQYAWQIGDVFAKQEARSFKLGEASEPPRVLDAASRALVSALHDGGPVRATAAQRDLVIARLEHHLVADSALNQFKLRPQIHRRLAYTPYRSFGGMIAFVYNEVFHTPRKDPWQGLLPRTDFTGLPGDGVVMP